MTREGPYPYASDAMIEMLKRNGIERVTISAECGDGWLLLIDTLIGVLKELGWDGEIDQIKEKFGGLRFYTGAVSDKMYEFIGMAEAQSFHVCENCGNINAETKPTPTGWLKTYCGECWPKVKRWRPE